MEYAAIKLSQQIIFFIIETSMDQNLPMRLEQYKN